MTWIGFTHRSTYQWIQRWSVNKWLTETSWSFSAHDKLFLKNFLVKYVSSLKKSIKNRFPTHPVLSALSTFNPVKVPERDEPGFSEYGDENMKLLAQQYFDRECNRKQLIDEWQVLKYDLVKWRKELPEEVRKPPGGKVPTITPTNWCLKRLLCLKDLVPFNLPLVTHMANAVVSLPVSNAWPEREATSSKLLKTRLGSRTQNNMFNTLLHMQINGPAVGSKPFEDFIDTSVSSWMPAEPCRKYPQSLPTPKHHL